MMKINKQKAKRVRSKSDYLVSFLNPCRRNRPTVCNSDNSLLVYYHKSLVETLDVDRIRVKIHVPS